MPLRLRREVLIYEQLLEENRCLKETPIEGIRIADADYKTTNCPPPESAFRDMAPGESWGVGTIPMRGSGFRFRMWVRIPI